MNYRKLRCIEHFYTNEQAREHTTSHVTPQIKIRKNKKKSQKF